MSSPIHFVFFGTGPLAESVLATLVREGFTPSLVVTKPDAPQGRHMQITAPHIKTWCEMKHIPVYQPETLRDLPDNSPLFTETFDVAIVASYGKIIPENLLSLPKHGFLNVHPSLLPLYRGASPIESALLDGAMTTGVSIIKLDSEMDHGPILAQSAFMIDGEATAGTMEVTCGQLGGDLLVQSLPHFLLGALIPKEQDHTRATFCKKIEKTLGEITLETSADEIQRKFRALTPWPGLYFFHTHNDKQVRVKVALVDLSAHIVGGTAKDVILEVIPESKAKMDFETFKRGYM